MADLAKLAELAQQAIADLDPSSATWERDMKAIIARTHTAAWLSATSERLNVPPDSALLSQKRLSRAERGDIKAAVDKQYEYLAGFVADKDDMSEDAIANRAGMYANSGLPTYYAARWGEWDIDGGLLPGNQQCGGRCHCEMSIADNGDGGGTLTRTLGGSDHCDECVSLAGEHAIERRAA